MQTLYTAEQVMKYFACSLLCWAVWSAVFGILVGLFRAGEHFALRWLATKWPALDRRMHANCVECGQRIECEKDLDLPI